VAALVEQYSLEPGSGVALLSLLDSLATDPLAPTTVRDPLQAVDGHLADSLVALELEQARSATTIADLGSGAGFPGLPLAIALPRAAVWLVESNGRKRAFIDRAAAAARLTNTTTVHARAEDWPEGVGRFDLVTARALAPFAVVAEYAAPLLRVGGALIAWRGRREPAEELAAAAAADELGLEPGPVIEVRPYAGVQSRHLHLMSKVRETPKGFPRRPGIARKRPLGGASDRRRR
jgi:16S rRNA (guanine527-N7)-methyltransferase